MKNYYKFFVAIIALIGISTNGFSQYSGNNTKIVSPLVKQFATSTFDSSPNLQHAHDGEHCLSDALTNHWIASMGIEEQYHAEQKTQAILAENFVNSDRSTYTVPIIFHVVHNPNNPAENVSQAAINNLFAKLNLDYSATNSDIGNARGALGFVPSNADIQFCLAQRDPFGNQLAELGIERVSTNEDYYNPDTESNKMKSNTGGGTGAPIWNRANYVNVWICDITNGAGSGVAGYAYKPTVSTLPPASIDGIVIDYNLGMNPSNRVLTHEIGHYLGLSHTWGNSNTASGCTLDDDLADTPNTAGPSFDYPLSCSGLQQTCPGTNTQYENYMDYANCTVMFTANQTSLMQLVISGSRNSLNSSNGCVPVNPMPPVANFSANLFSIVQGGSINFTDLSTNYPTAWAWSASPAAGVTFINTTTATSQNPTMQFANTGVYQITLTASNLQGSDAEVKVAYINVITSGGGTTACDTLRNYTQPEKANMTAYSVTGATGYYPGNLYIPAVPNPNPYQMKYIADSFFVAAPTQVRRLYLPIYQADDLGPASNVIFTVWGAGPTTGGPGSVLGTKTVALSALNAGYWNEINFTTPVAVNGEFWVGMQLSYPTWPTAFQDTVLFATTKFTDRPSGPSSTWSQGYEPAIPATYGWQSTSDFFTSSPNCSLVMDVLCSNGPNPTAVVSFPITETCEGMDVTMNGFGSTNTTSYYWSISDGTNDYYYTQGNLTTNTFTAGSWTIQLEVDGSCKTAMSTVYNLTVNPSINTVVNTTNEICIAADGTISIAATGGDGGAYSYSINTGATFQASGNYTGLIAGNYNYMVKDLHNCVESGVATVGNTNSFNPTITADQTIALGSNIDLTVTGGLTWTWYESNVEIGTTSTLNVSPTVTTTYVCSVTDASGCEAELEVTITVIADNTGIAENLGDAFTIYPNPTTGKFALTFSLSEARDMKIEIVNLVGEKVISTNLTGIKNQSVEFDLSTIANGVYFVTINSGNEIVSKKIIVRR